MTDDMRKRGVACVHVYCVDNILVQAGPIVSWEICGEKGPGCCAKFGLHNCLDR